MDLWSFCLALLLVDLSKAHKTQVLVPGEIARTSCALARHDCSRKGRRPLRAGGYVLPKILDARNARWRICDGSHGCHRQRTLSEEMESLFEAAIVNSSLLLRPHLPTLLEYSKRADSVLQVGASDTAWIAIVKGGLQRGGQLYQTKLTKNLMDFMQGKMDELKSHKVRILQGDSASEMLFFSSWRMDFESLTAKSVTAKYVLLHGTKMSGSSLFFEGLQEWLNNNRGWQFSEYSTLGAGLAVLSRTAPGRPSNCSEQLTELGAAELLEVRHDYPSPLGSTWHVKPHAVMAMQRRLASARCPETQVALEILRLFKDPQVRQGLMDSSWGRNVYAKIQSAELGSVRPTFPVEKALQHPELSLLLLHRGQLADDLRSQVLDASIARWPHRHEFWQILAEDLVVQRDVKEEDVPVAMHAIRRCFSLAHFDRAVVFRLLEMLEALLRSREATLVWEAVAGSPTAPWDDQRRSAASAVSFPAVAVHAAAFPGETFLSEHPEFKFARDYMEAFSSELLSEQLDIIRTYSASKVNGYCKDNGWCEYVFLMFEYCQFLAECAKVPQTCKAAQRMEEKGLRILRASLSLAGSPEVDVDDEHRRKVYIQPHASPEIGRMRLSCTLLVSAQTSSTLRLEGERPRVYRQGKCFWFDESMTHEMDFEATGPDTLRATLYLDALHPGYYQEREMQYYPSENSLPWWQTILEKMGRVWPSDSSQLTPRRYWAPALKPAPWMSFAVDSLMVKADICLRGDLGLLFHQNAFWTPGDHNRALVTLQLFSRMQTLLQMGRQDPDVMHMFYRNRDFTQTDLDHLTQDIWSCLALGCKGCEALELFGVCWDDLSPHILLSLFAGLAQTMHLNFHVIKGWFEILGFSFPPPGGYSLTPDELNLILTEKAPEIQAFFERL